MLSFFWRNCMAKRIGIVFFLFVFCMSSLSLQLLRLPLTLPAARVHGSMRVVVDQSRGAVVDRNGAALVHALPQTFAALKSTPQADRFLRAVLSDERYALLEPRLQKGALLAVPVDETVATMRGGGDVLLLQAFPRYGKTPLAPHLIGYLDGQTGAGVSGLEQSFDSLLSQAKGELAVRLAADAHGRSLAGASLEAESNNYCAPEGIQLTLDARVQRIAQDALQAFEVTQGAAVVLDCDTSEILALASAPAFDPNRIAEHLNDPQQPFFNRALGAYPVGSTFKCFIAAAALDQGISPNLSFTCTGELEVKGHTFRCKEKVHGAVNMTQALAQSCNLYFIRLAQRLQQQPAMDVVRLFGFGQGCQLAPGLAGASGNLPTRQDLALPGEWANLAFGQGKLLGTPLQMAAATACIANGGAFHSPTLLKATLDSAGTPTPYVQVTETRQVVAPEVAAQVRAMMVATVEEGSGKKARPTLQSAGGKTATAQSGKFRPDGQEILDTGFTGFFPAEHPRYVVTVFREHGRSGAGDCAPVFQRIANDIAREIP
jgi:cell division protein FtsI/penicillin-binding protein 2